MCIYKQIYYYFDDIFVYNESLEEFINHFCCVLNVLRNENLYTNFKNILFAWIKLFFLAKLLMKKV